MTKFVRLVFEEEIKDNATPEEALDVILKSVENYMFGHPKADDVEISSESYERQE